MKSKHRVNDPDLIGAEAALIRAAKKARQIAAMTGTPLVVYEKGRIVEKRVHVHP